MLVWRGADQPDAGRPTGPTPILRAGSSAVHACIMMMLALSPITAAYDLNPDSRESVLSIAKDMAADMMSFYPGNQPGGTPGYIPLPYYWWEAGALMGTLIDYWYYTGDTSWNEDTTAGLLFQVGDEADYMPRNQTHTEGNDDQGFWGLAVMSATEYNFPNPPADKPQWLALAQAVFNTQAARWNMEYCNGGLRWQIFTWNNGYDYKNTISQACFFALGARLALYTGNDTYAQWAEKTWDWTKGVGYIDDQWNVYDGAHIHDNCTELTPYQWTYNIGGFVLGAAAMYNYTEKQVWKDRVDGLLNGSAIFFKGDNNDIMTEVACEPVDRCNIDQQSFKAYLSRWLANVVKWYPESAGRIMPWLRASSIAAAKQCTGGDNGRMCGLKWNNNGTWDGSTGLGQQMAALEVTLANLIDQSRRPVTADSGGTSVGNPDAGTNDIGRETSVTFRPITTGDRAGAGILTALVLMGLVGGMVWVLSEDNEGKSKALGQLPGQFSSALASLGIGGAVAGRHLMGGLGKGKEKESIDSMEKVGGVAEHTSEASIQQGEVLSPVQMPPPAATAPTPVSVSVSAMTGGSGSSAEGSDAWVLAERGSQRSSRRNLDV